VLLTGYGLAEGQKTMSEAIEKAKKIAVSDGMKRFEKSNTNDKEDLRILSLV
jgi:recombination DNA repair RAD52 pathway protein